MFTQTAQAVEVDTWLAKHGSKSAGALEAYLVGIPEQDVKAVTSFKIISSRAFITEVANATRANVQSLANAGATYHIKTKIIYLREEALGDSRGKYYLIHEIGHAVYYNNLTQEQRRDWNLFYMHVKLGDLEAPSKYSKVGPNELFAEAYYYYRAANCPQWIQDWFDVYYR